MTMDYTPAEFGRRAVEAGRLILDLDGQHDPRYWDLVGEDGLYIGPMAQQFCWGRQSYKDKTPNDMVFWFTRHNQEYRLIYSDGETALVTCTYMLSTSEQDSIFLLIKQRLTMLFVSVDGEPRLKHIHVSDPHIIDEHGQDTLYNAGEELKAYLAQARERSQRCALTGLYNRNYYEENYDSLQAWFNSSPQAGLVMFFDLNNFKVINDSRGHSSGDFLLSALASALQYAVSRALPGGGSVVRFGGDEFVLLSPAGSLSHAGAFLRELRLAFARGCGPEYADVSFSAGFACGGHQRHRSLSELISVADARMLRCKRRLKAGR